MSFRRGQEREPQEDNSTDHRQSEVLRGGARRRVHVIDLLKTGEGLKGETPTDGTDALLEPGTFGEVVKGWSPDQGARAEHSRTFRPTRRSK